jgi:sigma-B regulation protein RsbQ
LSPQYRSIAYVKRAQSLVMDILKRNNVRIVGQGTKDMLFAHGFGCDQNTWRSVVSAFENNYRIVLFDYVGAGKSDLSAYNSSRYSSLEGYATDIVEICEALKLEHATFVGHSVSSMIGLLAALRMPTLFDKMVFIGPSACYINDRDYSGGMDQEDLESLLDVMDSNYLGWSRTTARAIMGNDDKPELGEGLANSFCATDPEIARQFARVTFMSDNRKDLGRIKVESLSIQTVDDILAPEAASQYIFENMPGNKLLKIKATGHCPHLSAPAEVISAIKSFVN